MQTGKFALPSAHSQNRLLIVCRCHTNTWDLQDEPAQKAASLKFFVVDESLFARKLDEPTKANSESARRC